MKQLRIGVVGPAGFGGSYLCLELISRGHEVIGISRNPQKLGEHQRYCPRPADINKLSIGELATAFEGVDVLVCEYGPHTAGHEALQYSECALSSISGTSSDGHSVDESAVPRSHSENHIER